MKRNVSVILAMALAVSLISFAAADSGSKVLHWFIEDGNDFKARWEHLRQANQYLIDNAVVVPLEQAVKGYLITPGLKGYITHQLGHSVFDLTRAYFAE